MLVRTVAKTRTSVKKTWQPLLCYTHKNDVVAWKSIQEWTMHTLSPIMPGAPAEPFRPGDPFKQTKIVWIKITEIMLIKSFFTLSCGKTNAQFVKMKFYICLQKCFTSLFVIH